MMHGQKNIILQLVTTILVNVRRSSCTVPFITGRF